MPYSVTGSARARLTLSAKLPKLTIAWSARPAVRFDRNILIAGSVLVPVQNIRRTDAQEKENTFSRQGNNRLQPYVSTVAFGAGRTCVGLEAQEPVWTARSDPDRLSLFLDRMRRNWKLATGVLIASIGCALALAFALPSYWRVEETLMPVTRSTMGTSNLGSLASLAGGLGGGLGALLGRTSASQDEALAVLGSRELFDVYATKENLLPILFDDRWDSENRRWSVSGSRIPTLRRGYRLFNREVRDIDIDRRTGIVTFSITWKDRALAMKWARDLVDLANAQLRARAMDQAGQDMRYLSAAMRKAGSDADSNQLNSALSSAYERALQDYMFAQGQPQYAFRIVDPPTYPDNRERVWPQRPLFAALGLILGVFCAIAAVHVREWWSARRQDRMVQAPHGAQRGV